MALSATTATTRSTIVAWASRMPRVRPRPGTPRKVEPATMVAVTAVRNGVRRGEWGRGGVNIGLPSHVGTGLLGHEISSRPVPVVARQQLVAAIFLVRLVV